MNEVHSYHNERHSVDGGGTHGTPDTAAIERRGCLRTALPGAPTGREDGRGGVVRPPREGVAAADPSDPRRDVLAVVLTDGSIQLVAGPAAKEKERPRWKNGRLRGPGWVMWWELRSWRATGAADLCG